MPPKDRNPTLHIKTEPKSSSLVGGLAKNLPANAADSPCGKILYATGQLSPYTPTTEPVL